ncbi:cation:proton antiporter [Nonomuraea sp. NPDC049695]|uniref:cation:proton antiporter domain-containing protein n=1 Tax=Nonomuraea sp. NPDC049695 TaxID=3154734 RepID=UPI00343A57CC
MQSVQVVLFLVALATVVATFADRISVPAPSLLVVAGLGVGLLPFSEQIHVTPEIVSLVVLPPLLYAAGEELSWPELKRLWRPVSLLAVGLVLASAAAVGFLTAWLTPLPLSLGFVLGAVLSSTDRDDVGEHLPPGLTQALTDLGSSTGSVGLGGRCSPALTGLAPVTS